MTRKRLFLPFILALIAILAACSSPTSGGGSDPDPDPNPNPEPTTGSLSIPLPGGVAPSMRLASAGDIDSYQIRITCTALGYDETYTGTPGSTLTIESLSAGTYTVYAEAHDTDLAPADTVIFTGSATVSVTAGSTATAVITLVPGFGDLSVEITIPDDYTPPVTRVKSYGYLPWGGNNIYI